MRIIATLALVCLCTVLCGCQAFLYPLISEKSAIEDPRVEGVHHWKCSDGEWVVTITKLHKAAYKAAVVSSLGKTDLLLQLTKVKDQTFFQVSSLQQEPSRSVDEQAGEGLEWAFANLLTSRPTYLVGKIVSFDPQLKITFFNASAAAEKHFSADLAESYQTVPFEYGHLQKMGNLIILPPDKLRKFIEMSANDPEAFADMGFANERAK